ncbi:hypothetical protein [Morganella morganii]|uniref:hypothetical protein n=1 Tax=Morganella morganii TaxID=582 RepID=UPI0021CFA1D7|nr:hypothetical protein [Morganella morganii]MCU6377678.1 hypothetical protein [Morganella morganii]
MSVSKYAKHTGVTHQIICDWAKYDTFPARIGKNIDVDAADAWRRQYIDGTDPRTYNARKSDTETLEDRARVVYNQLLTDEVKVSLLEESHAIKEHYLAELVKLEHSIKSGEERFYLGME